MAAHTYVPSLFIRAGAASALTLAAVGSTLTGLSTPASAETPPPPGTQASRITPKASGSHRATSAAQRPQIGYAGARWSVRAKSRAGIIALRVAASKAGSPYLWGAEGPHRFDCSGLTQYAFKRAGKRLPRTAAAQYNSTRHIPASQRRPGDLVFFGKRSRIYHVGIYAGHGKIWHSPRPGRVVRLEKIWTSVRYGRVV